MRFIVKLEKELEIGRLAKLFLFPRTLTDSLNMAQTEYLAISASLAVIPVLPTTCIKERGRNPPPPCRGKVGTISADVLLVTACSLQRTTA